MAYIDSKLSQLPLPIVEPSLVVDKSFVHEEFSHKGICDQTQRIYLEDRYKSLFEEDQRFNRKVVSFQANKGELVHGWIKYKEGFSSRLVETLIDEFGTESGAWLIDPFAGSATTLLVSNAMGINAIGIEILPICHLAWEAKHQSADYDLHELDSIMRLLLATKPVDTQHKFPHVTITEGAFSPEIERDLMFYTEWFEKLKVSSRTKVLCKLIITSILEKVSYTRKDGQYLRWDYRSEKVRKANSVRIESGKPPIKKIDKGDLPNVKEALIKTFQGVFVDISILQKTYIKNGSMQKLIKGNTLEVLPTLESNKYDGVITSPPYANRYDYTRTYALELAYLSMGTQINSLRQSLLSCTVESHSKIQILQDYYYSIDQSKKYDEILEILNTNPVLQEVNNALKIRWERGDMNNRGVLRMIEQYFQELTFVFAELFRISKTGSHIAFVNDNVRYGGEIIPVDTITTNLAEIVGFEPTKIYVLAQKKGNSSQQMERFGRAELRKSITIWRKP